MKNINKLEDAIAFYTLGLLTSNELVQVAQNLITSFDSEELNILAGESSPIMSEVKPLFEKFLKEEKIILPSKLNAQLLVAKYYANLIVQEKITPYDGAKKIWRDIDIDNYHKSNLLLAFVSGASQIEDLSSDDTSASITKKELENDIIIASRKLLRTNNPKLLLEE